MTPLELLKRILHKRLLAWRKSLETLDAASASRVLKILARGNKNIRKIVQTHLPDLLKTNPTQAEIILWTKELTDPIAGELVDSISDAWGYSALNSLKAYNDILSFDGKAQAIQRVPETLDELQKLALGKPFANRSLQEMVDTIFTGGIGGALIATIDEGMQNGWGYKKIVEHFLNVSGQQGDIVSQRNAITLSRSYVQQASVNAQLASYWNNRDVIKGLEWTAILDNRVCIKCAGLDGNEYLWEDEKPQMIAHPRCRCLWLPVVKSYREIGLDLDDLKEAERNWVLREDGNVDVGGKKIIDAGTTGENFGGWWKTLDEKQQVKSVGPVRTRLIREGKLKFSDLVDSNTGRVRTLEELGFTEGGKDLPTSENVTVAELEKMPFVRARKVIAENFRRKFPEWSEKPEGNLPIAVLPENDAKLIGAKATVAVISPYTIKKQKSHHPELRIEDYIKAQELILDGAKYKQGEKKLAYVLGRAGGIISVLKTTEDQNELFLVSLWKLGEDEKERERIIKKLSKKK